MTVIHLSPALILIAVVSSLLDQLRKGAATKREARDSNSHSTDEVHQTVDSLGGDDC